MSKTAKHVKKLTKTSENFKRISLKMSKSSKNGKKSQQYSSKNTQKRRETVKNI